MYGPYGTYADDEYLGNADYDYESDEYTYYDADENNDHEKGSYSAAGAAH